MQEAIFNLWTRFFLAVARDFSFWSGDGGGPSSPGRAVVVIEDRRIVLNSAGSPQKALKLHLSADWKMDSIHSNPNSLMHKTSLLIFVQGKEERM